MCLLSILLNNDGSYLNLINKRLIFNAITIQWFLQNYNDRCVVCNIFCSLKKDEILDAEVVERIILEHSSEKAVRNNGPVRLVGPNFTSRLKQ